MALIVQAGDLVLRKPAARVAREKFGTPELRALIDEMVATMRAAPGVGLAAPQIGVPLQIIVLEDDDQRLPQISEEERDERERSAVPLTAIVNPELEIIDATLVTFFEGCLSVSGWTALVPRAREVKVTGFTPAGEPLSLQLRGWAARILQHEVDHLCGTLYIDRMFSRSFARTDAALRQWSEKPVAEAATALGIELPTVGGTQPSG